MADLYHLLDELQEREEEEERRERHYGDDGDDDDDDHIEEVDAGASADVSKRNKQTNDNRRLTVETAATAEMSYEGDDDDDDDIYEDDFGSSPQNEGTAPTVPEALRRLHEEDNEGEGSNNNSNNNRGWGGGIEDLLEEEEFDKAGSSFKTGGGLSKSKTNKSSTSSFFLQDDQDQIDVQYEAQTLGQMYGLLHRQWLEEQHSPELLPIDTNLVEELKSKIELKQDELDDKISQGSLLGDSQAVHLLMADIEQQDLDRAKFVLADYLTMRLQKIESFALFYYKSNQKNSKQQQQQQQQKHRQRMSPVEMKYLEQYWALEKQLLETTVTDHMPSDLAQWKKLDSRKMIDEPDTTGYNFWIVQDEPLVLDDEIHEEHSCLIAKYSKMKRHMNDGRVRLLM